MINISDNKDAPGFDSPLNMLHACHDRIMDQCTTLQKLMQHLPMNGNDEQAKQAAQAILRYFDTAGQLHHQDEEIDLFPMLRASKHEDAEAMIKRLLDDHQKIDALWLRLKPVLQAISDGTADTLERTLVADFSFTYGKHVMYENTQLLPLSSQVLSDAQMLEMGKHMAERRGVPFPTA